MAKALDIVQHNYNIVMLLVKDLEWSMVLAISYLRASERI